MIDDLMWNDDRWLKLALLLPLFIVLSVRAHKGVRAAATRLLGVTMKERLMPQLKADGPILQTTAFVIGALLVLIALAGPAFDYEYVPVEARGLDVVVLLDVSRSMLADDGGETRLERARSAIDRLVKDLVGDRVGLVLFAGESLLTCPLSFDRAFFAAALKEAQPGIAGRGGTRIGPALATAAKVLDQSGDRDKVILLVTDAGDQESFPRRAAEDLAAKKIRVVAVGVGRTNSPDEPLVIDGQVIRKDGNPVPAAVDLKLLREMAESTRGLMIPPEETLQLAALFQEYIAPLERGESVQREEKRPRSRYQWFLLPGILSFFLLAGTRAYPTRKFSSPRATTRAAASLLALALFCGGCAEESAYETARGQFLAGEAKAAAEGFAALYAADDRPSFALAQAAAEALAGEAAAATKSYGKALASGDATIRARALAGLAALKVFEWQEQIGAEPAAIKADKRPEITALAEAILDQWQRARDADQSFAEATARQADFELYWRSLQSDWATADRAARREERRALPGRAFLRAALTEVQRVQRALSSGELRADLALDLTTLAEDLRELLATKIAENPGGPLEALKASVQTGGEVAIAMLEAAADELRSGSLQPNFESLGRSPLALTAPLVLWSSQAEALKSTEGAFQGLASKLQASHESQGLEDYVQRFLASELDEDFRRLLTDMDARLNAEPEAEQTVAQEFLQGQLQICRERFAGLNEQTAPKEVLSAVQEIAAALRMAVVDEELARGPLARVPRVLEESLRALRDELAAFDPFANPTDQNARFAPFRRRLQTLPPRFERLIAPKPENGEIPEDAKREAEAARGVLKALMAPVEAALDRAAEAAGAPSLGENLKTSQALAEARSGLRSLFAFLGSIEETLPAAVKDAELLERLAQRHLEVARTQSPEAPKDELASAPLSLLTLQAEEDLLRGSITELRTIQIGRLRELLRRSSESGGEDAPLDPRTVDEIAAALEEAEQKALLAQEGFAAARALATREEQTAGLAAVEEPLAAQTKALRAALEALERGRLPLLELARRLMDGAEVLEIGVHEQLAERARAPFIPRARELAAVWTEDLKPLILALGAAEERFLREAAPKPAEGAEAPDPKALEAYEGLKTFVRERCEELRGAETTLSQAFGEALSATLTESLLGLRDRARVLWQALALNDLMAAIEQGVKEEERFLQWVRAFTEPQAERDARLARSQEHTRALIPAYERALEQLAAMENSPLKPEVVEIARKNLPLAGVAMEEAAKALVDKNRALAEEKGTLAKRLLEEILEKSKDSQDENQDQQQEPQPQPAAEEESPQDNRDQERIARAIEERAKDMRRRERQFQKRPAVENDW